MTFRQNMKISDWIWLPLLLIFLSGGIQCQINDSLATTCDFDMDGIEQLLPHLPALCTEIYEKRNAEPELYAAHLAESKAFSKFYKKLNDYELRNVQNNPQQQQQQQLEIYPFEKDLRMDIYNKTNFIDCANLVNGEAKDFLSCLRDKHNEMEQLIPAGSSSSSSPAFNSI
ncbi:uncharacterized protein [Musca autumnalis]|uniref:uncharacterized protein n=1 Tax=Musca autumnalis TaxID=221902 RepID=UPI003CF7F598